MKVRFGVKTYLHYLQVMGFSFVHVYKCACLLSRARFTLCQHGHRPQKLVQRDKECVCVSLMRPNEADLPWQPGNVCSKWQLCKPCLDVFVSPKAQLEKLQVEFC